MRGVNARLLVQSTELCVLVATSYPKTLTFGHNEQVPTHPQSSLRTGADPLCATESYTPFYTIIQTPKPYARAHFPSSDAANLAQPTGRSLCGEQKAKPNQLTKCDAPDQNAHVVTVYDQHHSRAPSSDHHYLQSHLPLVVGENS